MKKLSKEYKKIKGDSYAYCPNCKEFFIDDMPIYGSLYCPNETCKTKNGRYCIIRGLPSPAYPIEY